MRKIFFTFIAVLVLFSVSYNANAQMPCPMGPGEDMMGPGGGMMGDGMPGRMGGGMMGDGMPGRMGGGMMGGGMMEDHQHMMDMCMHHLGLSDAQKEEIKAIRTKTMKEVIRKRADMQIARLELKELLSKDPVDMKAVEAKLRQIEELRTGMHLAAITAREEVKSKLTPEQKKDLQEMMEERQPMRSRRMQRMPMRPMDGPADEAPQPMEPMEPMEEMH